MPGIVRKLVIIAAVDGLLLLPSAQRLQRPIPGLKLRYVNNEITTLESSQHDQKLASLEAYGVVGLFTVASSSYLISISSRRQVAHIRGKPIYVITGVSIIPLSSQSEAQKAIDQAKEHAKQNTATRSNEAAVLESETSEDEVDHPVENKHDITDDENLTLPSTPEEQSSSIGTPRKLIQKDTSVAEDVIGRRGQYGRFAERWFSKKGWSVDKKRMQGMSADHVGNSQLSNSTTATDREGTGTERISDFASKVGDSQAEEQIRPESTLKKQPQATNKGDATNTLVPKLLRTTKMLLSSESFFFSYDYDITRRLGSQGGNTDLPLHKGVDPLFFWNKHLITFLIEAGQHTFVLPLMQGFVGQRGFTVNTESKDPSRTVAAVQENFNDILALQNSIANPQFSKVSAKTQNFLITLISRRSIMRPGLRYLRRGVDDEGHTANSVETEQILSSPAWAPSDRIYSFTQIRGSIPLYFSQSPYSFKPIPAVQHSSSRNHAAFERHFKNIISRYGKIQIVLLVDKQGGEAKIGEQYEEHTKQLNNDNGSNGTKIDFEWFDFHNICRGMKFENVSILIRSIGSKLDDFGDSVEVNGRIESMQSGVPRINCMDCLDRTNVVQSACGQRALEKQLQSEGITINLQTDTSTQWFNSLWADNGDFISKQYSSTAALKGDYTRTRKRDYRGAINDFGLTLSRYFNNIINDYFSQTAIDYLLGNVTDQVFEEFEADMMSGDPATSMQKLRESAIEKSGKIVIADQSEELLSGWTLLSPHETNTVRTFPFEEVVLLVTDAAIYAVRFDWNMEKVSSFERVDLRSITGIMKGVYITSTLATAQTDEQKNVGFIIKYRPGKEDIERVNTRSLSTAVALDPIESDKKGKMEKGQDDDPNSPPMKEELNRKGSLATLLAATARSNLQSSAPANDVQSNESKGKGKDTSNLLKLLAFKALPTRSSLAHGTSNEGQNVNEKDMVGNICEEIRRAVGGNRDASESDFIEEIDIISLAEARKSTGYLEQWGHSLKKLVWA